MNLSLHPAISGHRNFPQELLVKGSVNKKSNNFSIESLLSSDCR
jgi:hypothetical protein